MTSVSVNFTSTLVKIASVKAAFLLECLTGMCEKEIMTIGHSDELIMLVY